MKLLHSNPLQGFDVSNLTELILVIAGLRPAITHENDGLRPSFFEKTKEIKTCTYALQALGLRARQSRNKIQI